MVREVLILLDLLNDMIGDFRVNLNCVIDYFYENIGEFKKTLILLGFREI